MITGFNTDIKHNDKVYHIQTEDKGLANPYIESLIYVGGEILASKKTSYAEQAKQGVDEKWIGSLMEQQHRTMIAAIKRGRFDGADGTNKQTTTGKMMPVSPPRPAEDKTLDQVILDYLASEAESEHMELSLLSDADFIAGAQVEVRIAAKKSLSQSPIAAAAVEVKLISTIEPPQVIFKGKTAGDGTCVIRCDIPSFTEGTAAVIISAQSAVGGDEIKQLVKKKK